MEDSAEMGLIVKFEDESGSYVNGFEAGMIWQQMQDGVPLIDPDLPLHVENKTTLERMAKSRNYKAILTPIDDAPEWMSATFEKIISKLEVVK